MAKVKKRALSIALVLAMLLSLSVTAFAAQNDISIELDGKKVAFTSESGKPFVDVNGRTQVPLRVVMEQYGCDVKWDSMSSTAIITKGSTTVTVPIGKGYITVNGKNVPMDTAALVQDGHTYLPIRAVLEAFGANVKWDGGKVSVTSSANSGFDNIYVDDNGDLIFELANGSKINAGSVSSGKNGKDGSNGRDGVSVTDAYVDAGGDLMIKLSSGRTINAGNVGTGGSLSSLTFADYDVGTKFYLIQPTGSFTVPVVSNGTEYEVTFDKVYYELTADYTGKSEAWVCTESNTVYAPYRATMHIEGSTDPALAGCKLSVSFLVANGAGTAWGYTAKITDDGSFSASVTQGENGTTPWNAPKNLVLNKVTLSGTPTVDSTIRKLLAKAAGDWELINGDKNSTMTISANGKLIYNGNERKAEYLAGGDVYLNISVDGEVYIYDSHLDIIYNGSGRKDDEQYRRSGSYQVVDLTMDNFFDYYELKDVTVVKHDAFGELDYIYVGKEFSLKGEYGLDPIIDSTVNIEFYSKGAYKNYEIDSENETYTIGEKVGNDRSGTGSKTYQGSRVTSLCGDGYMLTPPKGDTFFYEELRPTKVQGTLYLIRNTSTTTD